MKRSLLLLLFATMLVSATKADEIAYYNKSWEEIKTKAKAEHKYIFIDCYTDWCGWCKVMDKETMTNPEVIATMNSNFVAVKMDMEHGEGIKLAMKYHINGFPSFLFFSPEGAYVFHSAGYQKPEEFKKLLKEARDKTKQVDARGFSSSIDVAYPEFYKNSYAGNGKRTSPKAEEVLAYLDKQKDLTSEENWAVIARFAGDKKYAGYFLDNIDKYRKLYGKVSVNDKLNSLLGEQLSAIMKSKDDQAFANLLTMIDKYMGEEAASSKIYCSMAYYKATENWTKYGESAGSFIQKNGYDNPEYINTFCWDIYEKCSDKKLVMDACKWMKEVTAKDATYPHLDTYASLLYKSGQLKDAKLYAEKAIAKGKQDKTDVKATEELLEKINGKK